MTLSEICAVGQSLSDAVVTDSYEYDAYGNSFTVSGTTPNEMMYRGEQYDSDLGLYYLRARFYNPLTGRFMSRDPNEPQIVVPTGNIPRNGNRTPFDPKALHKYLYAEGDPVNFADPRGRDAILQFLFTTADISSPVTPYEYGFGLGVAAAYVCYGDAVFELVNWEITGHLESPLDLPCLVLLVGSGV
jgi:RHS repeat-associated protein